MELLALGRVSCQGGGGGTLHADSEQQAVEAAIKRGGCCASVRGSRLPQGCGVQQATLPPRPERNGPSRAPGLGERVPMVATVGTVRVWRPNVLPHVPRLRESSLN